LKVNPILPVLLLAIFSFACTNRPLRVFSEKKMENVLYDIYLAEAEINSNYSAFYSDSARKQDLLNSVLKKHKITEADLDTSLAWYSGHLDVYLKINDNLSKRFSELSAKLTRKQEATMQAAIALNESAVILPVSEKRFLLTAIDLPQNALPFEADTVFSRYGGFYELQFNASGITSSSAPIVTLCVQCTDTTFVRRDTLSQNGLFSSSIDVLQMKQSRKIYGSFYFPKLNSQTAVFIQDFTLSFSTARHSERSAAK